MRKVSSSSIVPKGLHGVVCNKWKQFRGFRQQDAHELMRFLLDGLEEEVQKVRY